MYVTRVTVMHAWLCHSIAVLAERIIILLPGNCALLLISSCNIDTAGDDVLVLAQEILTRAIDQGH
jgi:hypothetical protein